MEDPHGRAERANSETGAEAPAEPRSDTATGDGADAGAAAATSGRWLLVVGFACAWAAPFACGLIPLRGTLAYLLVGAGVVLLASLAREDRVHRRRGPLIAAAVACLVVTAVDLALRPILLVRMQWRAEAAYTERHPDLDGVRRLAPGTRVDCTSYGDLAAVTGDPAHRVERSVKFVIDSRGYRNDADVGAGPFDVILLGDSFGIGSGTSQRDTWAVQLGERTGRAVYNLSPPAGSPWEEYATLAAAREWLPLRPGAVVVWTLFVGNDLEDAYGSAFTRSELPWRSDWERLRTRHINLGIRSPVRTLLRRTLRPATDPPDETLVRDMGGGRVALFRAPYADRAARSIDDVRAHPNYTPLARTFDAMRVLASEMDLTVLVVSLPTKAQVYPGLSAGTDPWTPAGDPPTSGFAQAVGELAASHGMDFVDLLPGLTAAARDERARTGGLLWWPDDTHWDPAGHAAAAALVAQRLAAPR